jgi:hypothetical protein
MMDNPSSISPLKRYTTYLSSNGKNGVLPQRVRPSTLHKAQKQQNFGKSSKAAVYSRKPSVLGIVQLTGSVPFVIQILR